MHHDTMFNLMKKALHLEGGLDGVSDTSTESQRRDNKEDRADEQSDSLERSRPSTPISMFRSIGGDTSEDDDDAVRNPPHNDDEEDNDFDDRSPPYLPELSTTDTRHNNSVDKRGIESVTSLDRGNEEDQEHHPLSFFFKPVDKNGNWNSKIEKEIEAARRAAAICVTVDHSHIVQQQNRKMENRDSKVDGRAVERLREALRNPEAKQMLRSIQQQNSHIQSSCSDFGVDLTALDNESQLSSLFRRYQYVVEQDNTGEGVSVVTSISTSHEEEDDKSNVLPILDCPSAEVQQMEGNTNNTSQKVETNDQGSTTPNDVLNATEKSIESLQEISVEKQTECYPADGSTSDHGEEKKEPETGKIDGKKEKKSTSFDTTQDDDDKVIDKELHDCLSATESDVGSVDGLPSNLQSKWLMGESPKEQMLASLDGIHSMSSRHSKDEVPKNFSASQKITTLRLSKRVPRDLGIIRKISSVEMERKKKKPELLPDDGPWSFNCNWFWGNEVHSFEEEDYVEGDTRKRSTWRESHDVPLAILDCANVICQEERMPVTAPAVPTSLIRVACTPPPPSYAETILRAEIDPRMQDWINTLFKIQPKPPRDGSYHLGRSRTVIVHEIARGAWTWCTEWSPDGNLLAVATENHHLAVIDTTSSTVWRVRHDLRIKGPMKNHTTHSIRSIAWGKNFIAIGGTGNAVSILAPTEPYPVLHTIRATGFVGALDWRGKSNILAIGSRLDKVTIARIRATEEDSVIHGLKQTESEILHTIDLLHWANSVKFSPDGGKHLAIGDAGGILSVYSFSRDKHGNVETNLVASFSRQNAILSVEWSPDGKWLYSGGEDRCITVVDCEYWEIVHIRDRERWVQCIATSKSGSHLAVGGVSSEISLLDTQNGWDSVMGIELKGLVPLSATWHPKDQYLALTGQNNSILVIETTNARHVKGHHLHSISPILAVEFSPCGRFALICNQSGISTIYSLSGTTFITAYELVLALNTRISARWSLNGLFIVIGGNDGLTIIGRKKNKRQSKKAPPNASGFSVKKIIKNVGETHAVSIDFRSQYIAVSGKSTCILDAGADFATVREWTRGPYYANAFSPDGRWFAMIGEAKFLTIYDTSDRVDRWRPIFSMKCDFVGKALAWGPSIVGGLLYLAYGGTSNEIFIMEIRTHEATWETVLRIPRDGTINALDWSTDGLLAAAIGNGTVGIIDLAYLQSGVAVNEMDYNWQRQALTCYTEIRRNRGKNSMKAIRWLPAAPGSDRLLAVGGTDGELEILDLTERRRCRGYVREA